MADIKPSEVLTKAADLIEPEGAWTQGAFAREAPGTFPVGPRWPTQRTCWCVRGAIFEVLAITPLDACGIGSPSRLAEAFAERAAGDWLVNFNDARERTQAEVVAALRKAADLARSEGQ